jgi:hypothetical protein
MDVLSTAWMAAGRPCVTPAAAAGSCARCARTAALVRVADVVSSSFTGWDLWASAAGAGLCAVCAWGYRSPELRQAATWVTARPPGLILPAISVLATLLSLPLRDDVAVTVPLRPGRKHLLPSATWGRIFTGEAALSWTRHDADRLAALARLRGDGFSAKMLAARAPDFSVMRRLPPGRRYGAVGDWHELAAWRIRRPWLELAIRVTSAEPGPRT